MKIAIRDGDKETMVFVLLSTGISFPNGRRPLHYAVGYMQHAIVKLLLARGADPNMAPGHEHEENWVSLQVAPALGDVKSVEIPIDSGAKADGRPNID